MNSGDIPLMVCTRETAILPVATLENIWPKTWNIESGAVVWIIALDGGFKPFFIPGMRCERPGMTREMKLNTIHQLDTNANCRTVRVTGCGKALRIDFDDVLESPDTKYHIRHNTTSFTDTGAFNASTISPALADPALARILPILSDIDPDLECCFGEPPREGARFNGVPEESQPVVTGGLLVVGRPYRLLEFNLGA